MNGWVIGYLVGAAVVLVIVAVLVAMITGARRTAAKAEGIASALHAARDGTAGLWGLAVTVPTADRIVSAASAARIALTPGGKP